MPDRIIVEEEVAKITDEIRKIWPSSEVPQQIYHYTDSKGLMGILASKKLWATDISYLNDSMELEYGSAVIAKLIDAKIAESSDALKTMLEDVKVFVNINSASTIAYVTCFCEDNNLLSQWRAYANRGAGYSIGIEAAALARAEYAGPVRLLTATHLRRVLYDRAKQESLVKDTIDRFCALFRDVISSLQDEVDAINFVANPLARELWQHIYYFKDAAFAEEKEWRIITTVDSNPWTEFTDLRFRPSDTTIIPYIERRLDVPSSILFDRNHVVWSVTLGPTLHPKLTERSLYGFLATTLGKGNGVYIQKSGIPLRL